MAELCILFFAALDLLPVVVGRKNSSDDESDHDLFSNGPNTSNLLISTIPTPTSQRNMPTISHNMLIGAGLSIGGNLMISIAMNVQKYSLTKIQERRVAQGQERVGGYEYIQSCSWWLGIGLMVLGEGGNFLAYGFGPASVIAPLGTTTVVANAYIARCLGERLRCQDILGTIIIVIGAFMIVVFSTQADHRLTASQIVTKLASWPFLLYLGMEVVIFVMMMVLTHYRGYKHLILLLIPAALIGSLTVLGAKAASDLIGIAIDGDTSQVLTPVFFIMLLVVLVTGVLQIRFVTRAMQEYDASIVVPVFFVFFTLSAILVGLFFYGEFDGLTVVRIFMFIFGCICSFVGVFMLTQGRELYGEDDSDDEKEFEKHIAGVSKDGVRRDSSSPLLPPPTSLHLIQPPARPNGQGRTGDPTPPASPSSEESAIEMQDMATLLRDSPKWPPMLHETTMHAQLNTTNDTTLSQRKPHKTTPSGEDHE